MSKELCFYRYSNEDRFVNNPINKISNPEKYTLIVDDLHSSLFERLITIDEIVFLKNNLYFHKIRLKYFKFKYY